MTRNYNSIPRGRFRRDQYNCCTTNIYTLMEIKLMDKTMQHIRMYNTALITQRHKRNFSNNYHESNQRFTKETKLPLSESCEGKCVDGMKVQWQSSPDGCCRHNSHDDTTDETSHDTAGRPSSVSPAQRVAPHRFKNYGTPITRDRRRTSRQYSSFMNECLRDLHTSFTRDDVCSD